MTKSKQIGNYELTVEKADRFDSRGIESVAICNLKMPTDRGQYAMKLIERVWHIGTEDGEDSSGRQKVRPMNIGEIVDKACDIAESLFNEMDARGWIMDIPDQAEIADMRKTDDDSN